VGADTGAQEVAKEVVAEDPSTQVRSAIGGRSKAEEALSRKPNVTKVEVVSVSSGEPSDLAEVAQPSRIEGPMALMQVG
jgi:hypothetical protein